MRIEPRYVIGKPPGTFDKRVFIGGSFRTGSRLEEIYKIVLDCDFVPISSLEFGIPWEETRHYSGRLVEKCKCAIFETSLEGGYYFEMEDAKTYCLITLCVWDAYHGTQPRISDMALTHDVFRNNNKSYRNIEELRVLVRGFLQNI